MRYVWYAIRTENGQEEEVRRRIRNLMPETTHENCRVLYCVKKKRYLGQWHDKRERFLPGYMFLVAEAGKENGGLKCSHDVPEWGSKFSPVGDEETEVLMKLTGDRDEIGMSYGIIRNGCLEIRQGVLKGMESRIRRIDRHKRKGYISMKIGNEEELAEIGLEITEKISS